MYGALITTSDGQSVGQPIRQLHTSHNAHVLTGKLFFVMR